MKILIKENNGGGLSLEQYDDKEKIVSVVTGLEFEEFGTGLSSVPSYGIEWDSKDCGGEIVGFTEAGNTSGICGEDETEITAADVVDDSESTVIIATKFDKELTLYPEAMGSAGKYFFKIEK